MPLRHTAIIQYAVAAQQTCAAAQDLETHLRKGASIIIADFKMPGLDGVSLVRKIRWECTGDHQRVPFILLSAALDKDTVFQARDAGASALLSKPIQARMVCERVLQVMRDEREFVIVDEYIGPDRRVRSADHLYDGEDRRAGKDGEGAEGGETGSDNVSDDDIDAMLAQ